MIDEKSNDLVYSPSVADMDFYYKRIFPFQHIFHWLSHSLIPKKDFVMREFAFNHRSGIYQRYNSYSNLDEFKKSVIEINPIRFEIGAVYNISPNEKKKIPRSALKSISKELVFDIDLTDYDFVRKCCQKTDLCSKCWMFIEVGSELIDQALREDFGFKHILWVFSGRRGAHCWVSDQKVRNLGDPVRKSIIDYLDVLKSTKISVGNLTLLNIKKPFHPHVQRSFDILKLNFVKVILEQQDPWYTTPETVNDPEVWQSIEEFLTFFPDKTFQMKLSTKWKNAKEISNSKSKWEDLNTVAETIFNPRFNLNSLNEIKKEIIFFYLYPRLDTEVSKQMNHLLKSPFCIHPSTGNVCVPFIPKSKNSDESKDHLKFNPDFTPNLKKLQYDMEHWKNSNPNKIYPKIMDYEKTDLKNYINYFASFVNNLIKDEIRMSCEVRKDDVEKLDF